MSEEPERADNLVVVVVCTLLIVFLLAWLMLRGF